VHSSTVIAATRAEVAGEEKPAQLSVVFVPPEIHVVVTHV